MVLPLFRRKADKEKLDKGSKNSSFASLPRISTPPVAEQEERYVEYNVEPEPANAPAPDTRLLSALGGCAVQVQTVETVEMSLPYLEFPRRDSSMSAYSTHSQSLVTPTAPTFTRDPRWDRPDEQVPEVIIREDDDVSVPIKDGPDPTKSFSHNWRGSANEEPDLSQLLSLTGGAKSNSQSPFGFETLGNKPAVQRQPRRVFEDDDDFYVPGFQAAVRSRAL